MAALEEASSEEDAVAAALGSNDEACSIAAWYDAHKNVTFKTVLVPLPPNVVAWLRSDGPCVLPRTKYGARVTARTHNRDDDCELSDSDDDGAAPHFPAVEKAIDEAIAAVGGAAFVKLNCSAPKDAAWLGSLECATAGDAFALRADGSVLRFREGAGPHEF